MVVLQVILYVEMRIAQHPIFEREGHDLYCEVPVNIFTASLGGEIGIPTLDGKVNLKIPSETQTGKLFRCVAKGLLLSVVVALVI